MKLLLVSLFLIGSMCPSSIASNVEIFEFGVNVGYLAFTKSGSIGLLEKIKRVSVEIPECTELKYVRVEINNIFGPPSVKFDWESHSVIIEYSALQISISQYTISAKVLRVCDSNPIVVPQQYEVIGVVS